MALIKAQIDDALETGNKVVFLELSDELNRLKTINKTSIFNKCWVLFIVLI